MPPATLKPDAPAQLLQRLTNEWKTTAARYHVFENIGALEASELLKENDDYLHYAVIEQISGKAGSEEFVASHLDDVLGADVPGNTRLRLFERVVYSDNWVSSALTVPLLEREAAYNADPAISLAAVRALHVIEAKRALAIVEPRLRSISYEYKDHKAEVDALELEEEQLLYVVDGISLPGFMMKSQPVFRAPAKGGAIRVAMMGDFGTRGEDQHKVAAAMLEEHRKKPFDFGLTLGDNFYFNLEGPDDPGFKIAFEDLYGPMGITFFPVFGNHDWGGSLAATEIAYSSRNSHWRFPAPYYTYMAGPAQFFAINTQFGTDGEQHLFSALQARWLQAELDKSTAKWKIVYGHMPPSTSMWQSYRLMEDLMPILQGRADVYISGHVHNLEQLKPIDGVNLFIIGSSGRGEVKVNASAPEVLFAKESYGFGVLEADDHDLTIRILGEDDKEMHSATFHK